MRMAKQHRRHPFSYRIRVQGGSCGYVALSDAESDDDAAERNVFLSVGGCAQHFLPVRHDLQKHDVADLGLFTGLFYVPSGVGD